MDRVGIVGASLAGLNAALELRRQGFAGRLTIIGDEPRLPYDRPPISKELLRGEWPVEQADLAFDKAALDADWRLGVRAEGLDAAERWLTFSHGVREQFDGLVIATGAAPRRLPGSALRGVHVLRTLDDMLSLRADLRERRERVAIIGGGFIGQEIAASCVKLGIETVLIEAVAPSQHVVGSRIAHVLARMHEKRGVRVRLGCAVAALEGGDRVSSVRLGDGSEIAASVVVVGVGVTPNVGWLENSGLTIDNGVVCDETCLAAPGIVAAGDVARWPNPRYGVSRRVEHWDNAVRQGIHAARRLLARPGDEAERTPYRPTPWFWSDQYGLKLQLVGSAHNADEVRIVSGSEEEERFVALYRRGDRLIGAFGLSSAGKIARYRRILEGEAFWDDVVSPMA